MNLGVVPLRKAFVYAANRLISPLEVLGADERAPLAHRPIFVVGPPRSGTTLLSQTLAVAFDVGYLSNLHNALWGAPSLVAWMLRAVGFAPQNDYRSNLGNTRAWLGHSEAPNYWLRFLPPSPHYLSVADVDAARLTSLRRAVRRLVHASGKPVLFKTVVNTGRLGPIAAALPEAVFLVVWRDPVDVAHSLLEARKKIHGSYEPWWSLEPPEIADLRARPTSEQVVEQVVRTYEHLAADRAAIGAERFCDVEYEALCDAPHATLREVQAFVGLREREGAGVAAVPASFDRRREVRIPAHLYESLVAHAARREGALRRSA
ncbi:MAG: sulfotransferase family protein [Candidatus Binatia bacterium]